jgi:hypothetical protein
MNGKKRDRLLTFPVDIASSRGLPRIPRHKAVLSKQVRPAFFLPDSRDVVDPCYDFINDTYGMHRKAVSDDVYAHEMFSKPNCDGILLSRSMVSDALLQTIRDGGGVHAFLRLPKTTPVMGDCGAFQYIAEAKPPYTCKETCAYYQELGFDYGITLDHIVVQFDPEYDAATTVLCKHPTDEMYFRYELSIKNAETMLRMIKRHKYTFTPVASAQGWSPNSYATAVGRLARAGFRYIALGGVARSSDAIIRSVLAAVAPVAHRYKVAIHVLGVARFSLLEDYRKAGVASCDSAAPILQAFKSATDNYYTPQGNYTAVRIPPVLGDSSPRVRKRLKVARERGGEEAEQEEVRRLLALEQAALFAVRAYAARRNSLEEAMRHLTRYEDEFAESSKHYPRFEKTLRDRPWEKCPCEICKALGVEVVILRGNNRNRRRGFHNTFVFYRQFQRLASVHKV